MTEPQVFLILIDSYLLGILILRKLFCFLVLLLRHHVMGYLERILILIVHLLYQHTILLLVLYTVLNYNLFLLP